VATGEKARLLAEAAGNFAEVAHTLGFTVEQAVAELRSQMPTGSTK